MSFVLPTLTGSLHDATRMLALATTMRACEDCGAPTQRGPLARKCTECVRTRQAAASKASRAARPEHYAAVAAGTRQKTRTADRARAKKWRTENLARARAREAAWRAEHPDLMRTYKRAWQASHPEVGRATKLRRRAEGDVRARDIRAVHFSSDGICSYCLARLPRLTVDHVVPVMRGGTNAPANLVAACKSCNCAKGTQTPLEFLLGFGRVPCP